MFLLAGLLLGGVGAGALRTALVAAPVLERARSLAVSGFVETVEQRPGSLRLTLLLREAGRLRAAEMPRRVRITLRGRLGDPPPHVGTAVSLRARLMPPPDAVMPGGYDFAFRAYFARLGATGFAFTAPREIDLGPPPVRLRLSAGLADLRGGIASRIAAALGRDTVAGALAVALIVGDRSAIPPEVTEVLRTTGLAHILAISGLHMALFSGAVFFVVRAGLALMREVSDTKPIDLWAAGAALAAAAFYLAISGASVATQRAFVMTALVLAGRMAGRRALTLRNAAIAALLILLPAPESLLDPGFQMSFAAVVALIAAYEGLRRILRTRERNDRAAAVSAGALSGGVARWFGALLLTSLVAGLATGAIGAFHFHRVAPLGPLVNLLAMPLVTLVVMPMAVLALALLPLGLEVLPLTLMGMALDQVVAVATWADQWTPAEGVVGAPSLIATLLFVLAGGVLCLAPGGARRLALVPFLAAIGLQAVHRQPDLLIASDGDVIALRDADGRLRVSARPGSFLSGMWLRAEGVPSTDHGAHALARGGAYPLARGGAPPGDGGRAAMSCDPGGCVALAYGPGGGSAFEGIRRPDGGSHVRSRHEEGGSGIKSGERMTRAASLRPTTSSGASSMSASASPASSAGRNDFGDQSRFGVQGGFGGPGGFGAHDPYDPYDPHDRQDAGHVPRALVLALTRKPEALAEDCARADILVTPLQAPADCAAPNVFDGPRLARDGAVALYLDPRPPDVKEVGLRETTTGHRTRDGLPFSVLARVTYETARPWTPRARTVPNVSPASAPEEDDWPAFMRRDTPDLAAFETTP